MSDKTLMRIVAFISLLCVVWALFVPSIGMAVALFLNALISIYLSSKFEKKEKR